MAKAAKKSAGPKASGPKMSSVPVGPSAVEEKRYRAQSALETITRAHEHMGDKALMREVKKLAQGHIKTLNKVTGR